ncbi:hypothetical protein CISG_06625 [Coccidioides immitis RMSCC 3703]|uniref:Uncharacterized protein n=1 Tax=Coccidioides immitis RMSCC 3703 TaxID=454286 RepID=A0A0J8R132_COCIT|nr:hypothetical protein CISG_06625 [Coccidioides immitis RMSCC 3703]
MSSGTRTETDAFGPFGQILGCSDAKVRRRKIEYLKRWWLDVKHGLVRI